MARRKYDFNEWYKNVTVDEDSDKVHGMMEYDLLDLDDKYGTLNLRSRTTNHVAFSLSKMNYLSPPPRKKGYVKFEPNRIICECLLCGIKHCIVNFPCMGESLQ